MWAVLGNVTFEVLTSPEHYTADRDYDYAEHKVVQAKPILQWVSDALETLSFDFRFHQSFSNPATEIANLRAAADQHLALPFVYGNGYHRGYFVITKIGVGYEVMSDLGDLVSITVRVALKEYVPDTSPGAKPPLHPAPAVQGTQPLQFLPGNQSAPPGFQPTTQPLPLSIDNSGVSAISSGAPAPLANPSLSYSSVPVSTITRAAP